MNLLLDSNMIILAAKDELPSASRQFFENGTNKLFYSVAAIWEMTIKYNNGKLPLPVTPQRIEQSLLRSGYTCVDINSEHIKVLSSLKDIHRDPFDRIMIAQSLAENLDFLTCDALLTQYGEQVLYYANKK